MCDPWAIDLAACRRRQQRLLDWMHREQIDRVVLTQRENIEWLTGVYYSALFSPLAALQADGRCLLVAPQKAPETSATDDILIYTAQCHSTLRNDQKQQAATILLQSAWGAATSRMAIEFSTFPRFLNAIATEWSDVEASVYYLRRRKESDELSRIRKAIAATERMYATARQIVRPGLSEIEMFNTLQEVAVQELGEPLTGTGNDYQCCSRGGPPRARVAQAGELYILDLGPAFRGYFADNCRTIAVTEADSDQQTAWQHIMQVFAHVQSSVRPGKNAKQLFEEAQAILDQAPLGVFNHHLGHGIGLYPHEAPHLNPNWDDHFEVGDVFTVEPGLYAPELRAGMRLENNYLVTENGVELLSPFPIEL